MRVDRTSARINKTGYLAELCQLYEVVMNSSGSGISDLMSKLNVDGPSLPGISSISQREYFESQNGNPYESRDLKQHIKSYTDSIWTPNNEKLVRDPKTKTVDLEMGPKTRARFQIEPEVALALNAHFCRALLSLVDLYTQKAMGQFDRGRVEFRNNFLLRYDGRLTFAQQLGTFSLFQKCVSTTPRVPPTEEPPTMDSIVHSLVSEGNVLAISHVNATSEIETYLFVDSVDHTMPFVFGANVALAQVGSLAKNTPGALLDMFNSSYTMDRSTHWLKLVTRAEGITIAAAGKSAAPSALNCARLYARSDLTFTFENVPPVFGDLQNLSTLYQSRTTVHTEYLRYCDPDAQSDFDSPVDSAIHKSIQLLGLVHTVLPCLGNHKSAFLRNMASVGQRLESDEDRLINMMTLMRSLQVDGEFERYFKVPLRRTALPIPYTIAIADSGDAILNWTLGRKPLKSLIPSPRII